MTEVSQHSNIERTLQAISCLAVGRVSGLRDLCSDTLVMELPFASQTSHHTTTGLEACLAKLAFIDQTFDQFTIAPHETYQASDENTVIVEATSFGQYKRRGGYYQNRYVFVFRFEGGKIVSWREFFNPLLASTAPQS